jgi:ribosomal protein L7/L12
MKITLTKNEASSFLREHSFGHYPDVAITIEDDPVNVFGSPDPNQNRVVNLSKLTSAINEVASSNKIEMIKRVRSFFADNKIYIGLAESKGLVELIQSIKRV